MNPVPLQAAWHLVLQAGRGGFALQAVLVVAQALVPLLGLWAMARLVDAVVTGVHGPRADDAFANVLWATGLAAAVAFVGSVLRAVASHTGERHARRLADTSTTAFQAHAARLDLAAFDRVAFHDLLQQAGAEAGSRPVRLATDGLGLVSALLGFAAMAWLLAGAAGWLPVVVAAAALPTALARQRHARALFAWQREHVPEQRRIGYLGAVLTGRAAAKELRALALGAPFAARLAALRDGLRRSWTTLSQRRAAAEVLVQAIANAAVFGAYAWLGHLALQGDLTVGGLVLQAQAVQRAQNAVRDLCAAAVAVHEDRRFLAPVVAFLALRPELVAAPPVVDLQPGAAPIDLAAVGFTYPDSPTPALRDVTFTIAPGERLALVGPNGSGKSTLVKLLCRLYDPTTGVVRAHGTDLRHVDPTRWRGRTAVLFQDAQPFELSLRENLDPGGGDGDGDESATWRLLDALGLGERIRALPRRLDTPWSRREPGGVEWSGGEQRRLLLARTLARATDLLLLDEPFAGLDHATTTRLVAWLQARPRSATIVLVDHRPAVLDCVDRIVWLEAGAVRAIGTAAELARDPEWRRAFAAS
jgi:ATP-binding cassette subfamily B protein